MKQSNKENKFWRPTNPHDRFCRRTAYNPVYASDFLRSYGGEILDKYVDLEHLQEAKTNYLSDELKEVIMDATLTTRLQEENEKSELLLHLEHKSKPSKEVVIQLLVEAALALHFRWFFALRENQNFKPPLQLMVVVYNGDEDWNEDIFFQDLYPNLPPELRPYLIQFKIIFINLRHYDYDNLPGKPETQAIVESLKRATDGTFISSLPHVLKHISEGNLDEWQRLDLTRSIAAYCIYGAGATTTQVAHAITNTFKEQESNKMLETIKNEWLEEGLELGREQGIEQGELRRGRLDIIAILRKRFGTVPQHIVDSLNQRTDVTAMESLFVHALDCTSIDDFESAL
jgi:hypothetical protein